ncbi:Frag1/DRAM/Sfk1 family-domain-containing protein [Mrakia frigida]|uniref:Frag1/DRAM/Sfk1 family protein n=1 Tax=Mrakia frigida TaxID=29902 RepID=UPI003FCC112D
MSTSPSKPYLLHTERLSSHLFFGPYVFIPLLSALVWLAGLLALVSLWAVEGTPRYEPTEASIVFISNIGAIHQKLFIGICVVTAILYILALFAERWLRHSDRLPAHGSRNRREVIYDSLAILFCILGGIALILLSCFNCFDYSTVHWTCTVVFIICIALSAVFQSFEIGALKKDYPDRPHLMRNSMLKLVIVFSAIAVAITFGVLYAQCGGDVNYGDTPSAVTRCKRITGAAAVCEWVIALIFDAYLFTLVLDLWPAGKSSPRYLRRLERFEQKGLDTIGVRNGEHVEGDQIYPGESGTSSVHELQQEQMRQVR